MLLLTRKIRTGILSSLVLAAFVMAAIALYADKNASQTTLQTTPVLSSTGDKFL
jgi:hypothetical protein